jgi:endonuclease-3
MTVLSQATSDTNSERAWLSLRARFPSWDAVLEAPTEALADAIRAGGIADVKARRIQDILREIRAREGKLELERLNELSDDDIDAYLCSLPGVGHKTASCVLLFSLGRAAFPIDTHVHRIAQRVGLIGPRATPEAAHLVLAPRVPRDIRYRFHMGLIRHGRTICRPRMPRCSECTLFDLCAAGPRLLRAHEAR